MANTTITQTFNAPIETVFKEVCKHTMLAEVTPGLSITVIKHSKNNDDGLGSIRAVGFGKFQPLREEVVTYEPPYLLEYKIVGFINKLIKHHHGQLRFTTDDNNKKTTVSWEITLECTPSFVSNMIITSLNRSIGEGLALKAKQF